MSTRSDAPAAIPKKKHEGIPKAFGNSLASARVRLRARRRSIQALLGEFRAAVEARAIDVFWDSRQGHRLRSRPEKIAQALLAVFAKAVIGSDGLILKEISSGIGFVDVGISFGHIMHIIELKILKAQLAGVNQLAAYMQTEGRNTGWLVLVDARRAARRAAIPRSVNTQAGSIKTVLIDVNPAAPHTL